MSKSAKSLKEQLKTVGRFPKFFAMFGVSSLVLPIFSYGATAATVRPSVVLAPHVRVLDKAAHSSHENQAFKVSVGRFWSKLGLDGAVRISTHYSALLYSVKSLRGVTTTVAAAPTTSTTVVALTPVTIVAPTTVANSSGAPSTNINSVNVGSAPSSVAPTIVAPTTTTTVAPVTTTTVAPVPATTTASSGVLLPVGNIAGNWNLTFDSEFNGNSLNTSKWSTGWFGSGVTTGVNSAEIECMDPSQVSVNNGELDLTAVQKTETCGGTTRSYASGMVTTNGRYSFTYGYMEARIWMPGSTSITNWPAFWANGQTWPTDGEIDVVEGLSGLAQAHFHYSGGTDGPLTGSGNYTGGWHTFGADWEPGSVTYYYDGVKIGSFTSGVTAAPMYLVLQLAVSSPVPTFTPGRMRIDYVRVWQH